MRCHTFRTDIRCQTCNSRTMTSSRVIEYTGLSVVVAMLVLSMGAVVLSLAAPEVLEAFVGWLVTRLA